MRPDAQIQINLSSTTPINRQIVDHLRTLLVDGILSPGDVLPSVRRLAIDLGVHFNTVADAYRLLAEEGWLAIRPGRDVRVLERKARAADADALRVFQRRLHQLVAEVRAQGLSAKEIAHALSAVMKGNES
jgi:GntR family transcriptional regulator